MKKLLLIIDYQNDFVADDGILSAGGNAQAIENNIIKRIRSFRRGNHDVLCTLDTHSAEHWSKVHPESQVLPLHCEEETTGWELYGQLAQMNLETVTKSAYMLDQADIDWMVRQYDVIELAGVTTDIYVLQNAIGLYNHAASQGLKIRFEVTEDCVATYDEASQLYSLDYMKRILGFKVLPRVGEPPVAEDIVEEEMVDETEDEAVVEGEA